jgi:hypothetical protein
MKHIKLLKVFNQRLKLFEGFEKEDYYSQITSTIRDEEFGWNGSNSIPITSRELNPIRELISEIGDKDIVIYTSKDNRQISIWKEGMRKEYMSWVTSGFLIEKYADEWFCVKIYHKTNTTTSSVYYKCDQIEGVIELIKDKIDEL